ncbi:MAG TPA: metal-dependent transcriptional regulator [Acidimicrobiales bacterium]|nr:metal-dependent transcriptional regulator [Acidimicrobiales bacterium]
MGREPSQAAARYLEAIYYLVHEGEEVRPGRLAEWLSVSPPTVTTAVHRLARDGLVTVGTDRRVRLTPAGEAAAASVVRRHRVVECWLTGELGLDWATADAEAERVSYALSDTVLDRLYQRLGSPSTCPHGNEIPGAPHEERGLVHLGAMRSGIPATVARISELAEHEAPAVLGLLDRQGLVPGTVVVRLDSADPGVVRLQVGQDEVVVSAATAALVWVHQPPGPSGGAGAGS